MRKNPLAGVTLSLFIVAALFCPMACADQGEALTRAASEGDLKQALDLLDKGVDVNARDNNGRGIDMGCGVG
jgi:hypothetical protein